jgi:hypothetical protein
VRNKLRFVYHELIFRATTVDIGAQTLCCSRGGVPFKRRNSSEFIECPTVRFALLPDDKRRNVQPIHVHRSIIQQSILSLTDNFLFASACAPSRRCCTVAEAPYSNIDIRSPETGNFSGLAFDYLAQLTVCLFRSF